MKLRFLPWALGSLIAAFTLLSPAWLSAQDLPRFTGIRPLTNREMALSLTVSNGVQNRIEV